MLHQPDQPNIAKLDQLRRADVDTALGARLSVVGTNNHVDLADPHLFIIDAATPGYNGYPPSGSFVFRSLERSHVFFTGSFIDIDKLGLLADIHTIPVVRLLETVGEELNLSVVVNADKSKISAALLKNGQRVSELEISQIIVAHREVVLRSFSAYLPDRSPIVDFNRSIETRGVLLKGMVDLELVLSDLFLHPWSMGPLQMSGSSHH